MLTIADADPCPFCGAQPELRSHNKGMPVRWYEVVCASSACDMRDVKTHRCGSEDDAVKVWNYKS